MTHPNSLKRPGGRGKGTLLHPAFASSRETTQAETGRYNPGLLAQSSGPALAPVPWFPWSSQREKNQSNRNKTSKKTEKKQTTIANQVGKTIRTQYQNENEYVFAKGTLDV